MKRNAQLYNAEDDVQMPELDEQMLDSLQETISIAIEYHYFITITFHRNNRNNLVSGRIR
ncbi:YolD-like family protein [Paenibacillus sp. NRS-1760]|uniref:YolD-like family protein n=1 Tax=Paenibacillus sp. NRS-1760 TaxID=3233902 RepID=UPI003D2B1FD0